MEHEYDRCNLSQRKCDQSPRFVKSNVARASQNRVIFVENPQSEERSLRASMHGIAGQFDVGA